MSSSWWVDLPEGRVTVADGLMTGAPAKVMQDVAAQLLASSEIAATVTGPMVSTETEMAMAALLAQYPDAVLSSNAPDVASLIAIPDGAVA